MWWHAHLVARAGAKSVVLDVPRASPSPRYQTDPGAAAGVTDQRKCSSPTRSARLKVRESLTSIFKYVRTGPGRIAHSRKARLCQYMSSAADRFSYWSTVPLSMSTSSQRVPGLNHPLLMTSKKNGVPG